MHRSPSQTTPLSRRRLAALATGSVAALGLTPLIARAAQPSASTEATPSASPAANAHPLPTTAEILPEYQELSASIQSLGQSVLNPLLEGDSTPLEAALSPEVKASLATVNFSELIATLERDQVRFSFAEVGAHFAGSVSDGLISGFFQQAGTRDTFTLTPKSGDPGTSGTPIASSTTAEATPVTPLYPTGTWSGQLTLLQIPFDVTFSGTANAPIATLTIAPQGITDVPLSDVAFYPEAPIGELASERAIPLQPDFHIYSQVRDWAGSHIQIDLTFVGNALSSVQFLPTIILPPDPAADHVSTVSYRLPWSQGAWFVFWGGDTEFQNYHTVAPNQRHALDIVGWQDGGTHTGDGTRVEDYFVWGQPLVAPAAGTVVEVFNDEPEQTPGSTLSETNPDAFKTLHPAGNHVVIQTAKEEFVYMAHMQRGSVLVKSGDLVKPGDAIGLVGNSGNTSEPHLHIHIQNVADFFNPSAVGIPLVFSNLMVDGELSEQASLVQGTFAEPGSA